MKDEMNDVGWPERLVLWSCRVREWFEEPPLWAKLLFFAAVFVLVAANLNAIILMWP